MQVSRILPGSLDFYSQERSFTVKHRILDNYQRYGRPQVSLQVPGKVADRTAEEPVMWKQQPFAWARSEKPATKFLVFLKTREVLAAGRGSSWLRSGCQLAVIIPAVWRRTMASRLDHLWVVCAGMLAGSFRNGEGQPRLSFCVTSQLGMASLCTFLP